MSSGLATVVDDAIQLLTTSRDRHALCATCYPPGSTPEGAFFVGLCGKLAVRKSLDGVVEGFIPGDACPDCVELVHAPCVRCSAWANDLPGTAADPAIDDPGD